MGFFKIIFLPVHYAMVGFSFIVSNLQIFICNIINKVIYLFTRKNNTKIQFFFNRQKEHPENLLLITLYVVTIISLVNIFVLKNYYKKDDNVSIFTYQNINTIDNNFSQDNDNNTIIDNSGTSYYVDVDFANLIATNSDTVGYIIIKNTNISYPIVQTDNNSYYLDHDFNHNYSQKGAIYADYRNDFKSLSLNTIIYGHHRLDNTMFGPLDKLFDENYYKNNTNQILLITRNKTYTFNIFSVYELCLVGTFLSFLSLSSILTSIFNPKSLTIDFIASENDLL